MSSLGMSIRQPRYQPAPRVQNGVVAMLIFITTEVMFFAGLVSAFIVVKTGAVWPPPGQPRLPIAATAVNTFILLWSGVLLARANNAVAELRDAERAKKLLGSSISLGAFFVIFQGYEWARLLEFGLTMHSSAYGAFFYLIVGAHALHAVAALLALGHCQRRLARGELTREAFTTTRIFWYFVVLLWPVLYGLVYLT